MTPGGGGTAPISGQNGLCKGKTAQYEGSHLALQKVGVKMPFTPLPYAKHSVWAYWYDDA